GAQRAAHQHRPTRRERASPERHEGSIMNRLLVAVAAAIWWLTACGSSKEIVVKTADGVEIAAKDIDANPLSLLPGGALLLANVQPKELFQSSLGGRFRNLAAKQFPLPPSAQFEP